MPRLNTANLAEQREWRRNQLISAAAEIALESGSDAITVGNIQLQKTKITTLLRGS